MNKVIILVFSVFMAIGISSCSKSKKLAQQHDDLKDTYETLKREMVEAQVTMVGEKVKVILPEAVLFQVNSAEFNKDYYPILEKMAKVLNKYDKTSILITGYTDISGKDERNMELSQQRADNGKQILVNDQVNAMRIHTWGRGSKDPVADNGTEMGRKQNRRVEYVIMYDYKEKKK